MVHWIKLLNLSPTESYDCFNHTIAVGFIWENIVANVSYMLWCCLLSGRTNGRATSHAIMLYHHNDIIMGGMASQITSLTIVYSIVNSDADQRKHQSSASLAFVRGIHRWSVNSPHKWPVTRKMFPFDIVIMLYKDQSQEYPQKNIWFHL